MAISTAVDVSAVARVVGIKTEYKDLRGGAVVYLPQRVAVIGQGNTASTYNTTKAQVTSAIEVAEAYGYGSPLHLAVLQLLPTNGDGVGTIPVTVYPLEDDGAGVEATGTITVTGTGTAAGSFKVSINNIDSVAYSIAIGDAATDVGDAIAAAINATLELPVTAVTIFSFQRTTQLQPVSPSLPYNPPVAQLTRTLTPLSIRSETFGRHC
jgi:phage tail sheath gpL-like